MTCVVFPNLIKLDCRDLDNAGRCSFPALKHLTVGRPVSAEFLNSLPADQMLSLEVAFRQERKNVVSAILQMKNLKSLKLTDDEWGEADDTIRRIFDYMHDLEEVRFDSTYNCITSEAMIATLANQNPKLWHVSSVELVSQMLRSRHSLSCRTSLTSDFTTDKR